MKLFIWENVPYYDQCSPGIAMTMASSKEEAIEKVLNHILISPEEEGLWGYEEDLEEVRNDLLSVEPKVITATEDFSLVRWGGS